MRKKETDIFAGIQESLPTELETIEQNKAGTTKYQVAKFFKTKFGKAFKRYFIDAFTGMAHGLFVTLIAGTILKQLGNLILGAGTPAANVVGGALVTIGSIASLLMGAGIGAGIARKLNADNLVIFSAIVAGLVGAFAMEFINGTLVNSFAGTAGSFIKIGPGNPIGAYIVSVIAIECGNLVSGKTKLDILLVPLTVMVAALLSLYIAWPFIKFVDLIAKGIELATAITPFVMGIVISVAMGILLTLPTSSAAMWIAIAMSAPNSDTMLIAGGAAVVGCAAHMVGFAVASFRENGWGGLISQGVGTSMLQIPNLMKNPKIMIPEIVASAVVGPLSTTVFMLRCNATGGGMGTAGFVGVFGTIEASTGIIPAWQMWLGIILLMFVLPAIISFAVSEILRRVGWIKFNDQLLS